MTTLTADTVNSLRAEAGMAGDWDTVTLCERWLRGLTRMAEDDEIQRILAASRRRGQG